MSGEVELDESRSGSGTKGRRGRGALGKAPVFSILGGDGRGSVRVVLDVKAETVFGLTVAKKEMEFRYDNRRHDILTLITHYLRDLVPKREQPPTRKATGGDA